jgi:protein-L-isoaspartate(D-aspartate) O-methyltransferase
MNGQQQAREQMIQQQVRAWDVLDPEVLAVMAAVPRERFVPEQYAGVAFADLAIPLGDGQHMLPPKMVGRILQALALQGHERVLEVGTGSGYLTACLARLARSVRSLEIRPALADRARQNLASLSSVTVEIVNADAFAAGALEGDWDAIVLTGALPRADRRFEERLAANGRLFATLGEAPVMTARLYRREPAGVQAVDLFETLIDTLDHAPAPPRFRF